jgi:maleamate amidohydrolase
MNAKYADVVKTAEVLEFFENLPVNMFDLPKGASVETPDPTPKHAVNF